MSMGHIKGGDKMNELLARIKRLLGLTDASKDDILNDIIYIMSNAIMSYCGVDTVPTKLEYICVEATIARYNRLGAEGLSSESIDVIQSTYIEDVLSTYYTVMDRWIEENASTTGIGSSKKVKFF